MKLSTITLMGAASMGIFLSEYKISYALEKQNNIAQENYIYQKEHMLHQQSTDDLRNLQDAFQNIDNQTKTTIHKIEEKAARDIDKAKMKAEKDKNNLLKKENKDQRMIHGKLIKCQQSQNIKCSKEQSFLDNKNNQDIHQHLDTFTNTFDKHLPQTFGDI